MTDPLEPDEPTEPDTPWTDEVSVGVDTSPAHDDDTALVPSEDEPVTAQVPEGDGSTALQGEIEP